MKGTTLFMLRSEGTRAFDGSTRGIQVTGLHNAIALQDERTFRLERGVLELARHERLDSLQSFTIEAQITPEQIAGDRRNIVESQNPGVALFIEPNGKLVGSVATGSGWIRVDSGSRGIAPGASSHIRLVRHENGKLELYIDERKVGEKDAPGALVSVGNLGFKIGAWIDGRRYPFVGQIADVAIHEGVVIDNSIRQLQLRSEQIALDFMRKTGLDRVRVSLIPDEGRARLQPVRDILHAAGVERLSDLNDMQITAPTVLTPGTVLVATRRSERPKIDWSELAKKVRKLPTIEKRATLASVLTNRNSVNVLKAIDVGGTSPGGGASASAPTPVERPTPAPTPIKGPLPVVMPIPSIQPVIKSPTPLQRGEVLKGLSQLASGPSASLQAEVRTEALLSTEARQLNPTLRRELDTVALPEFVLRDGDRLRLLDPELPNLLEHANPALWPSSEGSTMRVMQLQIIPVDTAVIIANRLDLTETELRIQSNVTKLYIIAEEIVAGPNARITWERPGGSTPARANDPNLDGRGWSGVHTKSNGKDGLDGENGRPGAPGIDGARGHDAPHLEVWVKHLTAIPFIDLNGENGRTGGRGQRGGRGGDGANGAQGRRVWAFGWHCYSRPGHGGHGGDGGQGGRGGRGGDGGAGGNITIGVLAGTLADVVREKPFKIKNQGGQPGQGGDGGAGGAGGRGGRAGIGETCKDAQNGRPGAQGQPGARGPQGVHAGIDGQMELFEFEEEAWNELLTRPWISELSPSEVFPGDTLRIRGSHFVSGDRVLLGNVVLVPTIHADASLSITIPLSTPGGMRSVVVRRPDGTESNSLNVGVKPRLASLPPTLAPSTTVTLTGNAILTGASVLLNGEAVPANVISPTSLQFEVPGTGGGGSAGGIVNVQIRNPDGRVSNIRTASRPRILEIPFTFGVHNLTFRNFSDGVPSWSTFEQTFGKAEVWHQLLDPIFGHPVLTAAYYGFYHYFLKGTANDGLATGFCTSLACLVADKLWKGETDATTVTKAMVHEYLTAIHGRLLSRESLVHFHDQGRLGVTRVELTAREVEATFLRGCDRHNAPLVFFIPSGAFWDEGYFDKLASSHCVMPYRFVYPPSHPGPALSADGSTTISNLDGVEMYVWDCNNPTNTNCRIVFRQVGSDLHFDYFDGGGRILFSSSDGITLGMMTNGAYLLSDHDLPFSGPYGVGRFIVDFLLSPADLQVTDGLGLRTGNFGGQIIAEIPGSLPAYLVPGMYLFPADTPLTRRIVGNGSGSYTFNSVMPGGGSLVIEGVTTGPGEEDVLAINGDGTQIRFTPGTTKAFDITLARQVDNQARAITLRGLAAAPGEELDITLSPELSLLRVGNRGATRTLDVKAVTLDKVTQKPIQRDFQGVNLPTRHDLLVAVPDWSALDMNVEALSFE